MSGTSLDALDCVAVDFGDQIRLLGTTNTTLTTEMRDKILRLCEGGYSSQPQPNELLSWAELDHQFAKLSAAAVNQLLQQLSIPPNQVCAIGSHGQTIRHFPDHDSPHSLQLGDPNLIAELTGITTVADFRRRDIASGGQGAPLVPAFHQGVFRDTTTDRVILNIGGIANITVLPSDSSRPTFGFDTGPGNTLMDSWIKRTRGVAYDHNGDWARSGRVNSQLLESMLSDNYFLKAPPKSTGRELFNLNWLNTQLAPFTDIEAHNIQATLLELTAQSIATDINRSCEKGEVLVCGGGALNQHLFNTLKAKLPNHKIATTAVAGLDPLWVEATAFAWLAKQTIEHLAGNIPEVTGAAGPRILGGIYPS
ncbi:MAG: anhydro-N-acetylmuramic acid kinase [Pseudomonadales bacterium]|nr:anhydro-N-acetylmuramic acid kinase [Pseudomonadales bacterium]